MLFGRIIISIGLLLTGLHPHKFVFSEYGGYAISYIMHDLLHDCLHFNDELVNVIRHLQSVIFLEKKLFFLLIGRFISFIKFRYIYVSNDITLKAHDTSFCFRTTA